ncbi:DUF2793 domain-containing protein [Ruegeria aquimaris]|uniref:DUF2793 domain-containing protein n=1 Tax=Ruegeria aquimaris TaxID=2984333 RepID=A0ABT3AQC2_9RHOB|nr:DUF2793 domain-containing protein [Ruegeria sp. XHP0148]MCV2890892.1 DUF2793 domain-containing protein [Ruegeria sp. XHP0148]
MTETSPKLGLPYIQPAQAQKHVTHNEAIRELDTLVQLRIAEFGTETAPGTPALGETHALGPVPGGAWAGQGGKLATWDGEVWQFLTPREGWLAWDIAASRLRSHAGGNWVYPDLNGDQLARLGIATAASDTNRLAVASEAVLFTHVGGDHRLKLNKAAAGDTASLLFQSDWTGHAEMGLADDTAFSLKVSADGDSWTQVMRADPGALRVDVPITGVAVQSSATDITAGRLMRADYGYGPGNILGAVSQSADVPTGAIIERGVNANGDFVRFADGTQICTHAITLNYVNSELLSATWIYPVSFLAGATPRICGALNASTFSAAPGLSEVGGVAFGSIAVASTSVQLRRISGLTNFASGNTAEIRVTAIGRWF